MGSGVGNPVPGFGSENPGLCVSGESWFGCGGSASVFRFQVFIAFGCGEPGFGFLFHGFGFKGFGVFRGIGSKTVFG